MQINPMGTLCLSLLLVGSVLPASAQPLQSQFESGYRLSAQSKNGATFRRSSAVTGPNGGAVRGATIQTDGQGNATYRRAGVAVGPEGNSTVWNTSGSGSYDPETGYSGETTTTVNGQSYDRSTSGGSTTVTNPDGEVTTYTRRRFR